MSKKIAAIHFGAGNIGRGLIASLYLKNNIFPLFIDSNSKLVSELNKNKKYIVNFVDDSYEEINDFQIYHNLNALIAEMENFEIKFISTSIGTKNFYLIKKDLEKLFKKIPNKINIIAFENDFLASSYLKNVLNDNNSNHNYINALVDRIVPVNNSITSNQDIFTEKYFEVILDETKRQDDLFNNEVEWTKNFEPFLFRKLWIINTTHLMLGYLFKDKKYVFELLDENYHQRKKLDNILSNWFQNLMFILENEFKFTKEESFQYIEVTKKRIFNKKIKDELKRLRRDPIKKLKPNERVFSLYKMFEKYNLDLSILNELIFNMISFIEEDDSQSKEIGEYLKNHTYVETLSHFANIDQIRARKILNKYIKEKKW